MRGSDNNAGPMFAYVATEHLSFYPGISAAVTEADIGNRPFTKTPAPWL